jgi:cell division protein FtsL
MIERNVSLTANMSRSSPIELRSLPTALIIIITIIIIIIIIIIQFNLFTCTLNIPEANYEVSTSRKEKTHTYKQNTKTMQ